MPVRVRILPFGFLERLRIRNEGAGDGFDLREFIRDAILARMNLSRRAILAACVILVAAELGAQNPFGTGATPGDSSSRLGATKRPSAASNLADTSTGKWVFANRTDDFANKSDQRLTLRAEQATVTAGDSVYAELLISCGSQFRGNDRRSMLVSAGIPVSYRHDQIYDLTQIQYRFDADTKPRSHFEQFTDVEHRVFYLGDFFGFYFSKGFFQDMLNAKELRIRYSPLLGDVTETLTFDVAGLRAAIRKLDKCDWPEAQ